MGCFQAGEGCPQLGRRQGVVLVVVWWSEGALTVAAAGGTAARQLLPLFYCS